jgi:ATP-dependent DNA ligase
VPGEGRLDFGELLRRARRRGPPAYLIVFDVVEVEGEELLRRPYRERRSALEGLFADGVLAALFTLCPATADLAQAQEWLDPSWGAVGIEGVDLKERLILQQALKVLQRAVNWASPLCAGGVEG